MDNELFDLVQEEIPKMDPRLRDGWAVHQIPSFELYIHRLWKQVAKRFPPCLTYDGYRRCTPEEEFRVVSKLLKQTKSVYDIANNDVYLVKYNFSLHGKPIPDISYQYLPFLRQGSIMHIRGSKFMVSPVIADVGLSISSDNIFILMSRGKVTFRNEAINVTVDGRRQTTNMIYSQIYNVKSPVHMSRVTTIPHYLFCKFGFVQTLKNIDVDCVVLDHLNYKAADYPEEQWTKFTTPSIIVNTKAKKSLSSLVIMVPKAQVTKTVISIIGCFFRVADRFPERITLEDYDSPIIWRVLLGKLILGQEPESTILAQMNNHINSIDGYVDTMVSERVLRDGYHIDTIYDLFYIMLSDYQQLVNKWSTRPQALYGKSLLVHRYLGEDIQGGISWIFFSIEKEFNKKGDLTVSELKRTFKANLPFNKILSLNSGKAFVKSVSTASDCLIHKVTSVVTMQTECSKNSKKKDKNTTFGETQYVDPSILELGGVTNLPDRDPTGRSAFNNYAIIAPDGTILENPKFKPLLDRIYHNIRRHR